MANSTEKKAPAKAVEEVVKQASAPDNRVAPLHPDAYRMAIAIVNKADIKGENAESVVLLKRELARVAGERPGQPRA